MTKTVRLVRHISGTRDGKAWPPAGEYLEVSDAEAAELIAQGVAADDKAEEKADADVHKVEKATANRSVKSEEEKPAPTLDGTATKRTRTRKAE